MAISWRTRVLEALRRRFSKPVGERTLEELQAARRSHLPALPLGSWLTERLEHALFGAPRPSVDITATTVEGAAGQLSARVYTPDTGPPRPLVVHYHGGGWTVGSPQLYDWFCTGVAETVGAVVVSVDYRKAPEHPAPAAAEDAIAAFRWLSTHPVAVGATPPVAVVGDSAGGNLAALVAIAARDEDLELAAQVLVYPGVDLTLSFPSIEEQRDAPILPRSSVEAYTAHYLSGGVPPDDPAVSPWFVEDVSSVAPALVQTAEHDPLVDEGDAYAAKLSSAGVEVRHTRYVDVPHGFLSLPGVEPVARQALAEVTAFLGTRLRDTGQRPVPSDPPERTP